MTMRTETDVRAMLALMAEEYETTADMDEDAEAVYETLLWFVGERTDDDVKMYFTE